MAKRSFDTVRIRLSHNLRSGIFGTNKKAMCRENSRGIKVLSVYILNGGIVYSGLSPHLTINFILIVSRQCFKCR